MGRLRSISVGDGWAERIGTGVLLLSGALILAATLTPLSGSGGGGGGLCLFCGELWLADFAANVLLFLPLGVGLGLRGVGGWAALFIGSFFSLSVEVAQVAFVTGRDANPMDIISNATGSVLGALLARSRGRWLSPGPSMPHISLAAAAGVILAIVAATGALLTPWAPISAYHNHWTDSPAGLEPYRGRVLRATVASANVAGGQQPVPETVHAMLASGVPLVLEFEAGPLTSGLSQLLVIESGAWDLIFVGPHGDDLVLKYGSRAGRLGLHQPTVRLPGALRGVDLGDTVTVEVWQRRTGYCLAVDSRVACPSFSLGSGWALLQQSDFYPPWLQSLLNLVAAALLSLPLGLWVRRSAISLLVVGVALVGLVVVPWLVGLRMISPGDFLAVGVGLGLGIALRWMFDRGARRTCAGRTIPPAGTDSLVETEVV